MAKVYLVFLLQEKFRGEKIGKKIYQLPIFQDYQAKK